MPQAPSLHTARRHFCGSSTRSREVEQIRAVILLSETLTLKGQVVNQWHQCHLGAGEDSPSGLQTCSDSAYRKTLGNSFAH